MNAWGLYNGKPAVIRLPDGNIIDFNGSDDETNVRELTDTARKYINDEYADFLKIYLESVLYDYRLEEKKFNSDFDAYEGENEALRDTLNEIESTLQLYESKVFDAKKRLMRKDLDAMLKAIHGLINEVI